jgi:hypothetical protein
MGEILSGWKDIANYMGKGVRTVQRYERELGLPVRRPAGRTKGSVLVTKSELDIWISVVFYNETPHEQNSVNLQDVKSQISELTTLLAQLMQSVNELAMSRNELARSRRTFRQAVDRVRESAVQARIHWKNSSRVA